MLFSFISNVCGIERNCLKMIKLNCENLQIHANSVNMLNLLKKRIYEMWRSNQKKKLYCFIQINLEFLENFIEKHFYEDL